MATIGLVLRPGVEEAQDLAHELIAWCAKHKHEVVLESESAKYLKLASPSAEAPELLSLADPIVSLGGDGTLIGVARHVGAHSPAMLGINFGTLGFLTEIYPGELFQVLPSVLAGKARLGERAVLRAVVKRGSEILLDTQAVNDVVVQKGVREKLLELDVLVSGEDLMRIRGDGLIVATPTGSTAYSLAAGGSIVYPSLGVVLLTPICAHSLTNRPLVLPLDREIEIDIPQYGGKVFIMIDGQISVPLQAGDKITVVRSAHVVNFVRSPKLSYFEILRGKLNWGIANHSR